MMIINGVITKDNLSLDSPIIDGGTIDDCVIGGSTPAAGTFTTNTLTNTNADALILGSVISEGGNVSIYRDALGNKQIAIDADAASNAKAVDIYGGVVVQNKLTVGETTLQGSYNGYFNGSLYASRFYIPSGGGINAVTNASSIDFNIPVGISSKDHKIQNQINSEDIFTIQATSYGVEGIEGKRTIQYAGQCHAKIDAGAADYNPSVVTSDYIVTVDTTAAARIVTISTEDRDSGTTANPRIFIIKDIAGNAGINNITVSLETAGTIDGAANFAINSNYGSITLMVDGTNGFII